MHLWCLQGIMVWLKDECFLLIYVIVGDRDNSLNVLAGEMKSQRKVVKNLKKKSLWSRSMEEVAFSLLIFWKM